MRHDGSEPRRAVRWAGRGRRRGRGGAGGGAGGDAVEAVRKL